MHSASIRGEPAGPAPSAQVCAEFEAITVRDNSLLRSPLRAALSISTLSRLATTAFSPQEDHTCRACRTPAVRAKLRPVGKP